MAWVLPLLENQGQDKRVESILVPCLDAGSNPAISTKARLRAICIFFVPLHGFMDFGEMGQKIRGKEADKQELIIP